MCRFCKIGTLAAKANYVGIPGEDQRARNRRIQTSTIHVRIVPGPHTTQESPVANIVIIFQRGRIPCFRTGDHGQTMTEQACSFPGGFQSPHRPPNGKQCPAGRVKAIGCLQLAIAIRGQRADFHETPRKLDGAVEREQR
jgi:hypothetical protein